PAGAVVQLRRDGGFVVATVTAGPTLLHLHVTATAAAALEPR
ncbi:MAG: hypothetical protein QOH94_1899, partial [Mycobacterium sp.]|nr:hypothetical protein [Mycobacterium sp.]